MYFNIYCLKLYKTCFSITTLIFFSSFFSPSILAANSNVYTKNLFYYTENEDTQNVVHLFKSGVSPNINTATGVTGLMVASQKGHIAMVNAFIDAGADLDQKTNDGVVALMLAAQNGHLEVVKKLLANGANPNLETKDGKTALSVTMSNWKTDNYYRIVRELFSYKTKFTNQQLKELQIGFNYRDIANELVRCGAKPGLDQLRINFNLGLYLDKYRDTLVKDELIDDIFIENFKSDVGFCNGLTLLYLYSKWLQIQRNDNKFDNTWNGVDDFCKNDFDNFFLQRNDNKFDNTWFKDTIRVINTWNGVDDLCKKDFDNFLLFAKIITFLQNPLMYYNTPFSPYGFNDLLVFGPLKAEKKLTQGYSIVSSFTLDKLNIFLANILHKGVIVNMYYYNHVMGLFMDGSGNYCYFDPNDKEGEIKYDSIDKIAEKVFSYNRINYGDNSPIGFVISMFGEQTPNYPNREDFLTYVNVPANYCPLCLAAMIGCTESVNYFLNNGNDHNQRNRNMFTPLILAAKYGNIEILKKLLKHGADPDLVEREGYTALVIASLDGQVGAVEALIDEGINPNQTNTRGIDALIKEEKNLSQEDIKKLTSRRGLTALIQASQNNQERVVEKLLNKGADPNQAMENYATAIVAASQSGHVNIVNKLITNKADVNKKMKGGVTALMLASKFGHAGVVTALINAGADPNEIVGDKITALTLASQDDIKDILQKAIENTGWRCRFFGFCNNIQSRDNFNK